MQPVMFDNVKIQKKFRISKENLIYFQKIFGISLEAYLPATKIVGQISFRNEAFAI